MEDGERAISDSKEEYAPLESLEKDEKIEELEVMFRRKDERIEELKAQATQ